MRGWVCRLQLLLVLASAVILRSESCGIRFKSPPNLEGQVPVFIFLKNRIAQLYLQVLGSLFVVSYDSQRYQFARTEYKTSFPKISLRIRCRGKFLASRCLAMDVLGSTVRTFRRHVKIS
jgi:hypothetical protein